MPAAHAPRLQRVQWPRLLACALAVAAGTLALPRAAWPAELQVDEGVVVKFGNGAQLAVRDRLVAGPGVVLTSLRDDSWGGQGTGVAQTAAVGDWRGLRIEKSTGGFGASSLGGLTIRFAGATSWGLAGAGLTVRGVAPSMPNLQVADSGVGVRLQSTGAIVLEGASLLRNGIGLQSNDSAATVGGSRIVGNLTHGIANLTPQVGVVATSNWWGSASGPRDPVANPAGQGNAVTSGVSYTGFLSRDLIVSPSVRLAAPATFFESRVVALELSASGATEYRVAEAGAFGNLPYLPLVDGRALANLTVSDGDGIKAVGVEFRNADGTTATAALAGGILLDTQAPALAVSQPSEGAVVSLPGTVEASASDASGVTRVEFYLDNQLRAAVSQPPYRVSWDPAQSAEGAHVWRIVAFDGAGRSTTVVRNITVARSQVVDVEGPTLTVPTLGGAALADGFIVTRNAAAVVQAVDPSGIARVDLLLDGGVVATASLTAANTYSATLDIGQVSNGPHTLAWRAQDSLGNVRLQSFNITVAHAPPDAPRITQPTTGLVTRVADLAVSGTAPANSTVQLLRAGVAVGQPVNAAADGRFNSGVTLQAGVNSIQATARNAYGTSVPSAPVTVTLDLTLPGSPGLLAATGLPQGLVRLSWLRSSDPNTVGYDVYRSNAPFTDVVQALRLNTAGPVTATSYDDLPTPDGTWYYRVVSVNAAGTASAPGNQAQAVADHVLPRATRIAYAPQGRVDPATGRVGQGLVNVVLTTSEPLQAAPFLAITPAGGAPVNVALHASGPATYSGSFTIDASMPSGIATATFSGRDVVGNRGTDIDAGATLPIDTEGPALAGIVLSPAAPIKNDPAQTVQVTLTYSKALAAAPQLSYLLSGPLRTPVVINGVLTINPTTYRASFTLPSDAGRGTPESLSFRSQAADDLGNASTKISALNQFQVYQGGLPPLDVPGGFSAKAQPGGKVRLTWQAVPGAAAYQILRQAPGQAAPQALVRSTGFDYIDQTPADGAYRYAVASVRVSNGQEALSGLSTVIDVLALATAPAAPQNLTLLLSGQGIVAQWQPPPASQVASYNLYRAGGTSIGSIQGLVPLKTGITATTTLDTSPKASESAYVVTAVDVAGNESPISNSAYLNASLLPVAKVRVEQIGTGLPALTWAAPNGNVSGYLVYVGPDSARTRLTPTPITSLSLTDTGFSAGERRYTIASVDATGAEMPRVVLLPAVSTQVVTGLPLQRGIMNRLQLQVSNTSTSSIAGVRAVVRVPINRDGTQFADHRSEAFDLGANQTRLVSVVVGGHADLPISALSQVGVEIAPNDGELVKLARSQTFDVTDGSLVVGMATQEFTRGGTGKLKLSVENTTEVDIELLTATQGGNADSSELRFKLLDNDGNVLATQAFRQSSGAGIVTLPNGQSVARIPAGSVYTSDTFSLNVPGASPNTVRVRLEVDKLRYRSGQADEVLIAGRGSERVVSLIDTAYSGEVTSVSPIVSYGDQDVIISGRALDRAGGQALPNTRLKLVLNQQGFERSFMVLTDGSGTFTHAFKPTLTDAGQYRVSAVHPDVTDRPEQKSFSINRVAVGPSPYRLDLPRTVPFVIPFVARSGPGTAASGLRFSYDAAAQPGGQLPADITLQLPSPVTLAERQTANMPVTFTGGSSAQPSGSLVLNLLSNERGSTPVGQVRVDYTLSEARPFLVATPSLVETGLTQGGNQVESVVLQNNGLQEALNLRFTLTKADGSAAPGWAVIASRSDGTMAIGERRSVDLSFTPPASSQQGLYEFKLHIQGDNVARQSVNVYVTLTQSGQGNVQFKASDIYTATVDRQGNLIPGLAGASITLQNEDVPNVSRELQTDTYGEARADSLPAGRYKFRVRASNHQEAAGRLEVRPGVTLNQPVFLNYTVVTVEWSVREITIQDRYEVTLNATFETDVPAPVVVMQPASVTLPRMNTGDVYYGELSITNYGLVRADNVMQRLPPTDAYFRYEFLGEVPTTLDAKQRVTLPYRIVALQSLDAAANASNASGGGCVPYRNDTGVTCDFVCANGVRSLACGATTTWFSPPNLSCAPPGGPGGGGGGGGSTSGWGLWSWIGGGGGGGGGGSSQPGQPGQPGQPVTSPPYTPIPNAPRCVANPNGPCP